jgi:hypothetical protein
MAPRRCPPFCAHPPSKTLSNGSKEVEQESPLTARQFNTIANHRTQSQLSLDGLLDPICIILFLLFGLGVQLQENWPHFQTKTASRAHLAVETTLRTVFSYARINDKSQQFYNFAHHGPHT